MPAVQSRRELWVWRITAGLSLALCAVLLSRKPRAPEDTEAQEDVADSAQEARPSRSSSARSLARVNQAVAALEQAGSFTARCTAVDRLSHMANLDDAALAQIVGLTEPNNTVELRRCSVSALGVVDHSGAIEPLVALTDDLNSSIVEAALHALASRPEKAAHQRAIELVKGRSPAQRATVAYALANAGAVEAVPFIAELLAKDEGYADQLLMALGRTGDPRAIGMLQKYLDGCPLDRQRAAIYAIGEIGGPTAAETLTALLEKRPELTMAIAPALASSGGDAARDTLMGLLEKPQSAMNEQALLNALAQLDGPEVHALMMQKLGDSRVQSQYVAIEYFSNHNDPAAVSQLVQLARSNGQAVGYSAMMGLQRIGTPEALGALEEIARGDSRMAGDALDRLLQSGMSSERAQEIARAQLERNRGSMAGVLAVAKDNSPETTKLLASLAQNHKSGMSMFAIQALAQRSDPEARTLLTTLAGPDSKPEVRSSAMWALAETGDPRAVTALRGGLEDADSNVRIQAVGTLARIGGQEAEAAIFKASRDKDPEVVSSAANALAQVGTPEALTRVEELAKQPGSSLRALSALAEQSPARAQKLAEELIGSRDAEQRRAALGVAGQLPSEAGERMMLAGLKDADPELVREALNVVSGNGTHTKVIDEALRGLSTNNQLPEDLREYAGNVLNGDNSGGVMMGMHAEARHID